MELAITRDIATLERLEKEMREDIHAFYRFGANLIQIRKEELYLHKNGGEFQTFEAYCKGVWDMGRAHAYRLMDSSVIVDTVSPIGIQQPINERQARPLSKLEPDQQRVAWAKAVESAPEGKVTAAIVTKVVKEMTTTTEMVTNKPKNITIEQKAISCEFKSAFNQMVIELKNARGLKWTTVSHKDAVEMMQILLNIAEQ